MASDTEALLSSTPGSGETLREKATKALHGPNANPSQLGDPISLKAEVSDKNPTPQEAGAQSASQSPPTRSPHQQLDSGGTKGNTLREKRVKKIFGPTANPSKLGDPISLEAEQNPDGFASSLQGASKPEAEKPIKSSKL